MLRRRLDDRGSSAVEFAVLFPIIVVLLFGGPQLVMWYFSRDVAQAAARLGSARSKRRLSRPWRRKGGS